MGGDGGFDTAGRGGFAVSGRLSQPRQPPLVPLHPLLDKTGLTVTGLSRRVACNGSRVREADTLMPCGGLTVWEADRWAIRCGLHPIDVWPDLWLTQSQETTAA